MSLKKWKGSGYFKGHVFAKKSLLQMYRPLKIQLVVTKIFSIHIVFLAFKYTMNTFLTPLCGKKVLPFFTFFRIKTGR